MRLNNIDFPNQILDAISKDKLVVFAGAGASVDKPTSLPNFLQLAKKIAEDTDRVINRNEPCEVFLGNLKAEGIDVNSIAAQILSSSCLQHNALHEAIIDIFPSLDKVKIVTTNYDQMFEQVIEERGASKIVYDAPSLPLGDDVNGVIHIHGNVDMPKYMVVTDEDFGRAYLTEGYVSRFLVKLFESYTILFIGYSYNDTIMRYLTRAMTREHSSNRYILTDDTKSNWDALGIIPIFFRKRGFAIMRNGIVRLGEYSKKGLFDWKNQFLEVAEAPPKDMTIETEVDYCLESVERSRVMSNCICGSEWLELLDKKGVFSGCFSRSNHINESDIIWCNWISEKIVGKEDNSLLNLFAEYGNTYNDYFADVILRRIISNESNIIDDFLKKYITILDNSITDQRIISSLIDVAYKRKMYYLCLHLFKKLFHFSMGIEKSFWITEECLKPKHFMSSDYFSVKHLWDQINKDVLPLYSEEIAIFIQKTIEDIHYQYSQMDNNEPWELSMLDIEKHRSGYNENHFNLMADIFIQSIKTIDHNDKVRYLLKNGVTSNSILLRKISLKAIRETNCFSSDEKIELLCNAENVWSFANKEQVFVLAQNAFAEASSDRQNMLIDIIEKGKPDNVDIRFTKRSIYNWCIWLKEANKDNKRLNSIISELHHQYGFEPCKHPELNFEESGEVLIADKSPMSIEELFGKPTVELVKYLEEYKDDFFSEYSKFELLNTFSECVKNNVQWSLPIIHYLFGNRINNKEIWNSILRGYEKAELSIDEEISLFQEIQKTVELVPDKQMLARYLWKVLQHCEIKNNFEKNEQQLFEMSLMLWEQRDDSNYLNMRLIDKTLNTTIGVILLCWLQMVSYSDNTGIKDNYKFMFEKALNLKSWEREVAICVLGGHFNFLCFRDKKWCIDTFEPMLTKRNKKSYVSSWEGITYYSKRINKDTAEVMAPIYLRAVKNINWLEGDVRLVFIELYLALLVFYVDKPTLKYIPEFYRAASEENRCQFVKAIKRRLNTMNDEARLTWWNGWLKRFIENRKSNKPVELTEMENRSLCMLLPSLDFVFDDAVKIICKGNIPQNIDALFWHELNDKKVAINHPQSTAKLVISLLNSIRNLDYEKQYVIQIVNELHGLDSREQKQLQEVLLKRGI